MRKRHDLTITAVSEILTNSTDYALQVVQARREQQDPDKENKSLEVPWMALLAAGAAVAAAIAYFKSTEEEIVPDGAVSSEGEGDQPPAEGAEDNEESLLDKVVDWIKSIPESKTPPKPSTMPPAPVVSNGQGRDMVNSPKAAPEPEPKAPVGVPSTVAQYISTAAAKVGIDPGLMFSVAKIESNFKVSANNKITGATGLFQFLPSTWGWLIKKYKDLGFSSEDINDPQKNAIMGAVYLKSIQNALSGVLGRLPSAAETYLGHFLGTSGAIKFLQTLMSNPGASAASMFERAARANRNLFYKTDGTPMTLAEVFDKISGKVQTAQASLVSPISDSEPAPQIADDGMRAKPKTTADATYQTQQVSTAAPAAPPPKLALATSATGTGVGTTADSGAGQDGAGGGTTRRPQTQPNVTYVRGRSGQIVAIPT